MKTIHLNTIWPATVGFDRFLLEAEKILNSEASVQSFPPHNIIKIDDYKYLVELAIAGFSKEDVTIKTIDGLLEIRGDNGNHDKNVQYLHKGIGTRSFVKTIQLADTVEVRGAQFKDGILTIALENVVPESKKPREIEITDDIPEFLSNTQLLTE